MSALRYLTPPTTLVWTWLMFGDPVGVGALVGMGVCMVVRLARSPLSPGVRTPLSEQ